MNKFYKLYLILIVTSLLIFQCGLMERKYPPDGEFCDVMHKPTKCIKVQFEKKMIQFSPEEVLPMNSISRVEYEFYRRNGEKIHMILNTEHRVKLSDGTFYIRKKTK